MPITSIGSSLYSTQSYKGAAQTSKSGTKETDSDASGQSIEDIFKKYAKMNPIERIRANYLSEHNLTEESLAAKPAAERDAIEKEIAELIKKKLGKDSSQNCTPGQNLDISV